MFSSSVVVNISLQSSNGFSEYKHKENMLIISEIDKIFSVLQVNVYQIKIPLDCKQFS